MMLSFASPGEDNAARAEACGGGAGDKRVDCFESSMFSTSTEGGDVWGGPLEPSALGGLPILVLCVLGLFSVAWTAFSAASSGAEYNGNKVNGSDNHNGNTRSSNSPGDACGGGGGGTGGSKEGERGARVVPSPGRVAPGPPPPPRTSERGAPPASYTGVTPSAEATPPAPGVGSGTSGGNNDDGNDDDDGSGVVVKKSPPSVSQASGAGPGGGAGERGRLERGGSGGSGGSGGVGLFFNGARRHRGAGGGLGGNEQDGAGAPRFDGSGLGGTGGDGDGDGRTGDTGEDSHAGLGNGGCCGGGSEEDTGVGDDDSVTGGCDRGGEEGREEEEEDAEEGESQFCGISSFASSSFADLSVLDLDYGAGVLADAVVRGPPQAPVLSKETLALAAAAAVADSGFQVSRAETPRQPHQQQQQQQQESVEPVILSQGREKNEPDELEEDAATESRERQRREKEERWLLASVEALLGKLGQDLDSARVLLPECNRFRKVVDCVAEAVGPGMNALPRQAMDVTEALREATEFSRTLSSPESFLVVMAELLADGFEDPSAMLGHCTRRLSRAVSALPEPSRTPSSRASAASARSQLRSLAKAPSANAGAAAAAAAAATSGTRSSSLAPASAAAAGPTVAATAATTSAAATATAEMGGPRSVPNRHPNPAAAAASGSPSSTATMAVTPMSIPAGAPPPPRGSGPYATAFLSSSAAEARGRGRRGRAFATSDDRLGSRSSSAGGDRRRGREGAVRLAGAASLPRGGREAAPDGAAGEGAAAGPGAGGGRGITAAPGEDEGGVGSAAAGTAINGVGVNRDDSADPRNRMGPALTNEAAGLSELIRRKGGLSALSDARGVAAVLRTAAPRRQSAFHLHPQQQRQPRGFFELEAEDAGLGGEEGGGVPLPLTPPRRGGGSGEIPPLARFGGGEDGGGEEEAEGGSGGAGPGGGNSTYVSTTCGGLFGTSKSPVIDSLSGQGTLPWPSPQDADGVCQKLAKRVEARMEAMVPFASPNPTPASERRRVRNANGFLFSITAGRSGAVAEGGDGGNGPGDGWMSSRRRDGGTRRRRAGEEGDVPPPPNLEEQLYAGLGALLEAAKELLPGARDGGAAVNAVGEAAVLTLKGACALDRSPSVRDTSLSTIPRRTSMCQHAICAPRAGRKNLDGGARYEDGVLIVPDCRKLRQEIVRSTCMDPAGSIRPDFVFYAGAPIFVDGAPLGTFCVFSRRTLKDLGWTAVHTSILKGLADAAATEMIRLRRIAEQEDQRQRHLQREESASPPVRSQAPSRVPPGNGNGNGTLAPSPRRAVSGSLSASRVFDSALSSPDTPAAAAAAAAAVAAAAGAPAAASPPQPQAGRSNSHPRGNNGGGGRPWAVAGGRAVASGSAPRVRDASLGGTPDHHYLSDSPLEPDGVLFLNGLDRRAGSSSPARRGWRRSMSEVVSSSSSRPPPVLARRLSAESSGGQAAAVAAAAAMAAAASSESPRGGGGGGGGSAKKKWHRALGKLRLRRRRKSTGGGSDDGDNGSSSSLDVSRRRTGGGSIDSQQVFRERSRAW